MDNTGTHDGAGKGGDHDEPFEWGSPRSHLHTIEQARLTRLRGYVMDARAGEPGSIVNNDLAYTKRTESGLYVPDSEIPPKDEPYAV